MPRVSEEHLERRRQQILDAARTCFIRGGIHETSMQDIFTESGLSAGAVYRYFKSKTEIIEAIMITVIGDLHTFFAGIVKEDPLPPVDEVAERIAQKIVSLSQPEGPVQLAPQAWALSLYDPELGRYVRENMGVLRGVWITYAGRLVDEGRLPEGTDPTVVGKALFGLLPGFLLQRLILQDISPEELRQGLRAVVSQNLLTDS